MTAIAIADTLTPNHPPNHCNFGLGSSYPVRLMPTPTHQLIEYLQTELAISADAIALGLRRTAEMPSLLPMVLWQYGLVSTRQLEQIFDWLESCPAPSWL